MENKWSNASIIVEPTDDFELKGRIRRASLDEAILDGFAGAVVRFRFFQNEHRLDDPQDIGCGLGATTARGTTRTSPMP